MNEQFANLSQVVSYLMTFFTFGVYVIGLISVVITGRSSLEKTLITIGLVIQAACVLLFLGSQQLHRADLGENRFQIMLAVNSVIRLFQLLGFSLTLFGVVKLLRRAADWESRLQDEDDDV
jgi:hypothetical protein